MINHFKDEELRCKCGCRLLKMNRGFRDALESIRDAMKRPMIVTSGVRCSEHNKAVGGHPKSLHVGDVITYDGQTGCMAVDISTPDGAYRGDLFRIAWHRGWSIGWNAKKSFLHLDRRVDVGIPQTSFDY